MKAVPFGPKKEDFAALVRRTDGKLVFLWFMPKEDAVLKFIADDRLRKSGMKNFGPKWAEEYDSLPIVELKDRPDDLLDLLP